jgi:N-methylhydantoinase A
LSFRLGFDVGGTFTDFVLENEETGEITPGKRLTSARDPADAVLEGLEALLSEKNISLADLSLVVHGTTLASNLVIERKGAPTGLITTRGFRDVLLLQRQLRINIYDLFQDRPAPLIPRYLIQEVGARMDFEGTEVSPLDPNDVSSALRRLAGDGVVSVAVCLLHSYANPEHERRVRDIIRQEMPQLLVSLSSDISPQWREYERTNTTVVNAYAMPAVRDYLGRITGALLDGGYRRPLYVMQSNGGVAGAPLMREQPVHMIESGPAAGAIMAARLGRVLGVEDLIAFDMGGTTAKVSLVNGGRPATTNQIEIERTHMPGSGLPLQVPGVEILEVGSGGGSIARVHIGTIAVGPESARAEPGPICYGLGGALPTVTDADLVLGYLNPSYFLGGQMSLDPDAAAQGIFEHVARPLGLNLENAAWGIHQMVNDNMSRAIRLVTVDRGREPRRYAFVAFGGAGPVHGARLARALGTTRLILPAAAGVMSAMGLLAAGLTFDLARTYSGPLNAGLLQGVNAVYNSLEREAERLLQEAGVSQGYALNRSADMHYLGQGFEITVPIPSGRALTGDDLPSLHQTFHQAYAAIFGYSQPEEPVVATNWNLTASGPSNDLALLRAPSAAGTDPRKALKGSRLAYFPEAGGYVDCLVYDRYRLGAGMVFEGPAIVEEAGSTSVVLPGDTVEVDGWLNLLVQLQGGQTS